MFRAYRLQHRKASIPFLVLWSLTFLYSARYRPAAFAFRFQFQNNRPSRPNFTTNLVGLLPRSVSDHHPYRKHLLESASGKNSDIPNRAFHSENSSETMIVRVRSNLGTMKLVIKENQGAPTKATVRKTLLQEQQRNTGKTFRLTQDLSFDPSGSRLVHPEQTLGEQGISHGDMLYCRLEEADDSREEEGDPSIGAYQHQASSVDNTNGSISSTKAPKEETSSKPPTKESKPRFSGDSDVIDLIDSSSDEEDDDDIQVLSPTKVEPIARKKTESSQKAQTRKRQRLEMDATNSRRIQTVASNRGSKFQIASYNVWFGPPDPEAKQVFPRERMTAIVECLQKSHSESTGPLSFVGLQELTPSLVQYLKPHFQNIGYRLETQPIGGFGQPSYGIGLAFPNDTPVLEYRFVPFSNSMQARGFLYVRTPTILFATTHLESWCGPQLTGSKEREVQLVEMSKFCEQELSHKGLELAVMTGDLNWDDERKRKPEEAPNTKLLTLLSPTWKDTGNPFDFTYDAKENPMLGGNLRRRFDRCLYTTGKGSQQEYRSTGLKKIGNQSLPNLVWNKRNSYNGSVKKVPVAPSDHFGIVVSFSNEN